MTRSGKWDRDGIDVELWPTLIRVAVVSGSHELSGRVIRQLIRASDMTQPVGNRVGRVT
jgi:hypothetical protein